jgi:hypothetical protein
MNVGITGHQKLDDPQAWLWVAEVLRDELLKIPQPLLGVTSLAIGADQLLAALVLELGGSVHAILPYRDIERSFSNEDLKMFQKLVSQATVEILSTPGTDEDAYLAAGKRVVDLSEVVLAVWNGLPAKGKGGTADVVSYARKEGRPVVVINPVRRTISPAPKLS